MHFSFLRRKVQGAVQRLSHQVVGAEKLDEMADLSRAPERSVQMADKAVKFLRNIAFEEIRPSLDDAGQGMGKKGGMLVMEDKIIACIRYCTTLRHGNLIQELCADQSNINPRLKAKKRRHRLSVVDAPDGLGQDRGDGELLDIGRNVFFQRDRVSNDELLDHRAADAR